jgi:hypothetical protein
MTEAFDKDKFEPNLQHGEVAGPTADQKVQEPAGPKHEDGSPMKPMASVAVGGLPTDVTVVQDQLIHTHQDTGVKTLVGRIRDSFVEFTKWGERMFEGKPKLVVTPVEGAVVPAAVADSTDALQNDGLPATINKSLVGNDAQVNNNNFHTIANDGLPATHKRQPEVLTATTGLADPTVDASVQHGEPELQAKMDKEQADAYNDPLKSIGGVQAPDAVAKPSP